MTDRAQMGPTPTWLPVTLTAVAVLAVILNHLYDADEVYFRVQDGTHTTEHWCHQGDLLALYEPAGWSVDTAVKPTYALTRRHGVEDHHDVMTDGGPEVLWTHSVENDIYYRVDAWTRTGSGNVIPKSVEEVPEERVPPEHRRNTLGLNRGVLS